MTYFNSTGINISHSRPLYLGYAWSKVPFKNDFGAAIYGKDEFGLPGATWRCKVHWNGDGIADKCEMFKPINDREIKKTSNQRK